jgi:PAS domain S-box-containing protein
LQNVASHLAARPTGLAVLQAGALGFVLLVCLALFALEGLHVAIGVVALVLGLLVYHFTAQIGLRVSAQRAAETATAAAAEAAAQYRLLADNATDMILRLDLAFIWRYVSPACREILGYEPASLVGTASIDLLHPDDAGPLGEIYRAMAAGCERADVTGRARHRDGRWVWVELRLRLIRDAAGEPCEIVGTLHDVTRRIDAQKALRESQARLQSILDCAPVAISLKDLEHRYVVINRQYQAWYGVAQEEQLGRPLSAVGTDASFTELMESIEDRVVATGQAVTLEVREPDIGTAPVWESITKFPIRGADGIIIGVGTLNMDVSERKAAEAAIRESEERFRLLVEGVQDYAIYALDTAGRVTSWNISASSSMPPTTSSARIPRSSIPRRTVSAASLRGRSAPRCAASATSRRAGACARTAAASGPASD